MLRPYNHANSILRSYSNPHRSQLGTGCRHAVSVLSPTDGRERPHRKASHPLHLDRHREEPEA